ncbi:MAG: LacI family DNA-binding transcriptional regulator [Planctomycetota bacterium]|jgi:DNA-binding LacI/PurR family transcriptional regulator|nr:LacI family DNA-binding transcriptional regulator [Planctomycetota bacterium]
MSQRVTQSDIARHLAIGQKTVSRALGAPGYIAPDTRERVLAAAGELGYRRHSSAAAMRTGCFRNVILLQGKNTAASTLPQGVLHGICDRLAEDDIALTVARYDDEALATDGFLPRALREVSADGLLIKYDINVPAALSEHLERHHLPAVWINSKHESNAVYPDDFGAGQAATQWLLAQGHRHIAYLDAGYAHNPVFHYSRDDRLAGYRAAMHTAGLATREHLTISRSDASEVAEHVARAIEHDRPTALLTYGGGEAAMAVRACALRNWVVGQDVAILSVGSERVFAGLSVTSMVCSDELLGHRSADLLIRRLHSEGASQPSEALPFQLVPGRSASVR